MPLIELNLTAARLTEIFTKVRALLAEPDHWIRGTYARDLNGESIYPESARATCWCLSGAVRRVTLDEYAAWTVLDRLDSQAGQDSTAFNDTHSHREVLDLIDRTIASLTPAGPQ